MADMMDTLKELLGDNADEKLNTIMETLNKKEPETGGQTKQVSDSSDSASLPVSPELLMQAQGIMEKLSSGGDDQRTRLLTSLKPYMRSSRRSSIDDALKILNIVRLSQLFQGGLPL